MLLFTVTIFPNETFPIKKLKSLHLAVFDNDVPITQKTYNKCIFLKSPSEFFKIFSKYKVDITMLTLANKTLIQSLSDVDVVITDSLYICSILLPEMIKEHYILSFLLLVL